MGEKVGYTSDTPGSHLVPLSQERFQFLTDFRDPISDLRLFRGSNKAVESSLNELSNLT